MVKTLNIPLNDEEHARLIKLKGDISWHEFMLEVLRSSQEE